MNTNRWTPYRFVNGVATHNRVVIPAMASETADAQGIATEKTILHYQHLAEAGAGIIFVEYSYVHPSGRSEPNQLGAFSDAHFEGFAKIARVIKQSGAMAGLQIVHAGGKTTADLTGGDVLGPSDVPVPVKDRDLKAPKPMDAEAIDLWKQAFVRSASRAATAGFDLVEIHAAHGYGFNQWLSPITNRRVDRYGGGWRERSQLLVEVIEAIRKRHPKLLLSVRIPGQDFIPEGLTLLEMISIAERLCDVGIDLVNVSSGLGGWRRPRDRTTQGYLIEEAAEIQARITRPVIGVGGIEDGDYIDMLLSTNRVSFAAVGRAILKDPKAWNQKNLKLKKHKGLHHDLAVC